MLRFTFSLGALVQLIFRSYNKDFFFWQASNLFKFKVLATAYTCFAISDMLIYNSRKRKEWTEQQENKLLAVLEQAHQATAQGAATEEQLRLLKIENVVDATERERAAKGGTLQRAKSYWYSMYSNEKPEESEGQDTKAVTSDESTDGNSGVGVLEAVKEATQSRASSRAGESPTLQAIRNNHDRSGLAIEGGVFDKAGAEAVDRARTLPNRWRIWLQGK